MKKKGTETVRYKIFSASFCSIEPVIKKIAVKLLAFTVIITLLFSFSSCSGGTGENFYYPISSSPKALDPQIAQGSSADIIVNNCFEGLVRVGADGTIIPGVAQSWSISSDGLLYTFNLRRDTHWHALKKHSAVLGDDYAKTFDSRVTAHDFEFAFKRALAPATNAEDAAILYSISNARAVNLGKLSSEKLGVIATDDFTLSISLKAPDPDFLYALTSSICMPCNESFFTLTKGKYGLSVATLICNGPFYLGNWGDSSFTIYNNSEFYKGNSNVIPNAVYLYVNDDEASVFTKFSDKVYDAASISAASAETLSESNVSLAASQNISWCLGFNCEKITDAYMRLALFSSFDRKALNFTEGSSINNAGLIPECCKINNVSVHSLAGNAGFVPYDSVKAVEYWNEALSNLNEAQHSITLLCTTAHEAAMRQIIQQWQQTFSLTVTAKIEVLEYNELISRYESGDYQLAFIPIKSEYSSPFLFLETFLSDSPFNYFKFMSESYDSAVSAAYDASSKAEAATKCVYAEEYLIQNAVVYPLLSETSYFALNEDISGIYAYSALENVCFISAVK